MTSYPLRLRFARLYPRGGSKRSCAEAQLPHITPPNRTNPPTWTSSSVGGATRSAQEVVRTLGYYPKGRTLVCDSTPISLDFPKGPLAVGEESIQAWRTISRGGKLLHVIRPEDSVKDRLSAFFYWKDRSGLNQAIAVARATDCELAEIEAWAIQEGESDKYQEFLTRL